jgi:putative ABC transport system substrate-binding protein
MNNRRKVVIAIGAAALAAPFAALAQQQSKVWRVGYLGVILQDVRNRKLYAEFLRGMRDLGYVEGKNLIVDMRSAEGNYERLFDLAVELTNLKVDVIISNTSTVTKAAQKATSTIPIVMVTHPNPVGDGLIASLARPGSNITGLSSLGFDLYPKHLEMLRSMSPKLARVAILMSAASTTHPSQAKIIGAAGEKIGIKTIPMGARDTREIEHAFADMVRQRAGAVIVLSDALLNQQRELIAGLALKHRLPSISLIREFPESGGLMNYGPNYAEDYYRAATYVDKIFKGTKPGDIPVEQPTKFELIINGKTAKALGLKIPQSLLIMANKVIE